MGTDALKKLYNSKNIFFIFFITKRFSEEELGTMLSAIFPDARKEKARLRVWNPAGPRIRSAVWQPGRRNVPRGSRVAKVVLHGAASVLGKQM
jgi:hypothetical protein